MYSKRSRVCLWLHIWPIHFEQNDLWAMHWPKRHLHQFSRFCRAHELTNIQSDHGTLSVAMCRYRCDAAYNNIHISVSPQGRYLRGSGRTVIITNWYCAADQKGERNFWYYPTGCQTAGDEYPVTETSFGKVSPSRCLTRLRRIQNSVLY